jgi:hypothetical protein
MPAWLTFRVEASKNGRIFNVGWVLVVDNHPAADQAEIQYRSSAGSQ